MVYFADEVRPARLRELRRLACGGSALRNETQDPDVANAAPHARTAAELQAILAAERHGDPFLLWRDRSGIQVILSLAELERATIGRRASNTIAISDDREISRVHAELTLVGGDWTIDDDGLARNGTFANGVRITQRKRLFDGDVLRLGQTVMEFRRPAEGSTAATSSGMLLPIVEKLTETQRRVLVALCRPYKDDARHATPASNIQIAAEVFLGVDAVKNHLRVLFQRFEIAELPQNQKRARLVECAFQWGLVSERDLV